jgi:hypothetical protein
MKKLYNLSFALLFTILLSCNSTKITSSWRDPEKHLHKSDWKKVLVVALLRNETNRHRIEDEMVKYLNGKGVTSYNYLGEKFNRNDEAALRTKIKEDGFDAAITMRLIDVEKEKVYTPEQRYAYPVYYSDFSRYYNRNLVYYTTPGYYAVTKKFIIETVIYSIPDDKIIWSGITETYDPQGVEKLTNEIANAIHKKMLEEGFVEK